MRPKLRSGIEAALLGYVDRRDISQSKIMLDGVSLDQLRTFIAAADEGSFSAAGRRLRRAQSVVSQTLAQRIVKDRIAGEVGEIGDEDGILGIQGNGLMMAQKQ